MPTSPVWGSRSKTRRMVLDLIRAAGTISRVELATSSGLTPPTISDVVRDLILEGLVVEAGRGASTGGKPPTLLRLNPTARYSVGVLLERNACVIVVIDLTGRQVGRTSFPGTAQMPPEQALPLLAGQVTALLDASGIARDRVLGIGLVSHGPQDRPAGRLLTPQPTNTWYGYPVGPRLAEILGVPVLLDNDAAAAAIGEYWLGAVDPRSTYGCLYMSTGIGGGVVVAGEVYRGSSSNSVEIGHISVDVHGDECPCGNRGCLENYAGPAVVVRQALAVPALAGRLALDPDGTDFLTGFARIAAAANDGDTQARHLIDQSAGYLGHAAVTITALFDLDTIVLAGPSFAVAGPIYRTRLQQEVNRRSFARRAHPVRVVLSVSGSDAAAIGGAVLVLQSELAGSRSTEPRATVSSPGDDLPVRRRRPRRRPTRGAAAGPA